MLTKRERYLMGLATIGLFATFDWGTAYWLIVALWALAGMLWK